jgi:hypothetical protein
MPLAAVAAAGIGVAGSIYASNKASKANKQALNAQQQANQQALDLQRQTLAQQQANLAPYLQTGYSALDALRAQFGLAQPASGAPGSAQAGGYDINAYIQANPDVAAARNDPNIQRYMSETGQTFEQWVGNVQMPNAIAAGEQRQYPTVQAQQGATPAPGAPSWEPMDRPDVGSAPAMPDLSFEAYEKSPGYEAGLLAGQRNLNANFGARGLLQSGAGAQAAIKFGTDYQNQDYNNWRNAQLQTWQAQLGQYNQDRARTDAAFAQDRAFGRGVYDTGIANLFGLASLGNPSQANALLQTSANNQSGLLQQGANNLSSYYGNQAANAGGLMGNLVGAGQGLLGNLFGGSSSGLNSWLKGAASNSNLF